MEKDKWYYITPQSRKNEFCRLTITRDESNNRIVIRFGTNREPETGKWQLGIMPYGAKKLKIKNCETGYTANKAGKYWTFIIKSLSCTDYNEFFSFVDTKVKLEGLWDAEDHSYIFEV